MCFLGMAAAGPDTGQNTHTGMQSPAGKGGRQISMQPMVRTLQGEQTTASCGIEQPWKAEKEDNY